jgi:hypothetical protein
MVKPISLRVEDAGLAQSRPAVSLTRAAACHVRAGLELVGGKARTLASAAAELGYRDNPAETLVQRAATSAADLTSTGWAHELGGVAILDLVQSITSISAAAEVIGRGLKIDMDRYAEYRIPGRVLNAAAAGMWTAEETAAPARQLAFSNTAILQPRKLSVLAAYTREQAESSNIEAIVRQTLGESSGLALDSAMFSNNAGSAAQPPGLLAGVTPLTPTAITGSTTPGEAAATDVGNLFAALAAVGAGKTAVLIMSPPQAVRLKMIVGPKFDIDIITSTVLPAGVVVALEVASLASGFSSVPEFQTSKTAIYHSEDTAPTDITGGSPSPASPVKSLWQSDAIGLKMNVRAAWGLRAAGHVQWIQSAAW